MLKNHKYFMIALLFMGSAILSYSCEKKKVKEEVQLDLIMNEESENLSIVVTENGRRSYFFTTPLLEGYTLGKDPYREFRKGIKIITYQDDSMTTVNATLIANYAINYEKRKLWEAKGNVEIHKTDGTSLYTQQLFWNSATKRIYSNVDTKVETLTDTYFAEGFESDEDLNEMTFSRWNGKVEFEEEALNRKDSLETGNKAGEEKPKIMDSPRRSEHKKKETTRKQPVKPIENEMGPKSHRRPLSAGESEANKRHDLSGAKIDGSLNTGAVKK